MWLQLDRKDKFRLFWHKFLIFALMVLAVVVAVLITDVKLTSDDSKISVGVGGVIVGILFLMAIFNRIKVLFKLKFAGFIVIFITSLFLLPIMNTVVWGSGLLIIPLFIDDAIINPYWKIRVYRKYKSEV